nr:MAG TPA: hypothetical protein [Caudoviricetes sp.]
MYYKLSLLVDTKACLCYACYGDFEGTFLSSLLSLKKLS